MAPTLEDVLPAAQAGEAWAVRCVYDELSPRVLAYLKARGATEPEDLTSEVFLGVFRRIGAFSGDEDQFRSWVFTIAHRRLTDERRALGCRPRLADAPLPDARGGDVEEEALRRLSVERVRALCSGLAPDQCDVLLLRLVSGLTVEAVADIVGKSPGAVKAVQRRGVAAIRRILEREGVPL